MKWQSNSYVEPHGDILTFTGSSKGECAGLCLAISDCEFIEFHGPERRCNLFSGAPRIKSGGGDTAIAFK